METSSYWRRLYDLVSPGEWVYEDAHYLVVEMDVDPVAAGRWVPPGLRLTSPATASVFTAWFPRNSFGSVYSEVGVLLHVEHRGVRAVFSPWMLVDDDVALVLGRELLGYPKKMGAIELRISGDHVLGVASRRGVELVRMEGTLHERIVAPPPMLGRPHRNVRSSMGVALPKLVAFTPREHAIEVRRATLDVRVGSSERDPLAELGLGVVRAARLHRVNLAAGAPPWPAGLVSPLWFARQWLLRTR